MTIAAFGLSYLYGEARAVEQVSFEVRAGEVFGLLGPNGAGKTTLLRMLAGILEPAAGHAEIMGVDVRRCPAEAKRQLGFLSGDTALYARLTVEEMLGYFAKLYGLGASERSEAIGRVTDEFGIGEFIDQRCGSLSSGQLQRANLARAFVTDPSVLILDEPTVGLDVLSGRFVVEAIDRARTAGKAVLFSTHIMSEVEALCDRVGLLLAGGLRRVGPHAALLAEAQLPSLAELILAVDQEIRTGD